MTLRRRPGLSAPGLCSGFRPTGGLPNQCRSLGRIRDKMVPRAKAQCGFTGFAQKVYKAVLSIPLGEVRSYKWVAKKAGRPKAFRAVGRILKDNPWPIIIPCHRVVKSDNNLGGYSLGIDKKKRLLELEKKINSLLRNVQL